MLSRVHDRVEWVDVAKGIAIMLVVLYHSVLLLQQMGVENDALHQASMALQVLRMPLFFTAAGIFAGSVVRRPWGRLWSSRLSLLVWTFLLWSVLRFTYFMVVPMEARPQETSLLVLLTAPILPRSGLWFLHSLVAFFVVAKLLHGRVAPRWQVACAAALSLATFSLPFLSLGWRGIGVYFVFFLAGMHGKAWLLNMMRRPHPLVFVGAVAGMAVLAFTMRAFEWTGVAVLELPIRVSAVVAGFVVARWVAELPVVSPVLQYLGRNTLPIYVAHVILVAAFGTLITTAMPSVGDALGGETIVVVAVLAVLGALALHQLCRVPVLRCAYEPPAWFSRSQPVARPVPDGEATDPVRLPVTPRLG